MNRFVVLAIAGCIASTALSVRAYADPIIPDPAWGVRGATGDPLVREVTDGSAIRFQACNTLGPDQTAVGLGGLENSFCVPYTFVLGSLGEGNPTISSFDLSLWDAAGNGIHITPAMFSVDTANSDFTDLQFASDEGSDLLNDFVVRLARGEDPSNIFPGDLVLFLTPVADQLIDLSGWRLSIQLINGNFVTDNAPDPGSQIAAVPEPTTITLLGTGIAGLVLRRRKMRKTSAA